MTLSESEFVRLWRDIVGEDPAIVAERDILVGVLLEGTCPDRRAQIYARSDTAEAA